MHFIVKVCFIAEKSPRWRKISDHDHFSEYRKGLELLACETGAAFFDMEVAWAGYVPGSGKDLEFFKRDCIDTNECGEQFPGCILEGYFSLPAPDTTSAEGKAR